jgi:hypothetical protein
MLGSRAGQIISMSFVQPDHDLSYQNVTFVERDNVIVGMVSGYTSKCQQNFLLEGKMNFPDLLPSNPMHSSYQREVPPEGMMNAHYRKWLRYPLSL